MKLTMLKPRIATLNTSRVAELKTGARAKGNGATARGYNYRWQKARERFLKANPLCCYCYRNEHISFATVVDHIIPHRGDQALFWDESNWQALCKPCHDSVKAKEEYRGESKV